MPDAPIIEKELPYTLLVPIEQPNGTQVTTLNLRRAKVRDLAAAQKHDTVYEQTHVLLTRLASLAPEEVDELDAADWSALSDVIMGFLEPPTTTNS